MRCLAVTVYNVASFLISMSLLFNPKYIPLLFMGLGKIKSIRFITGQN
jgi:hypothetical protein